MKLNEIGRRELWAEVRSHTTRLLDDDCYAWESDAELKANEAQDVDRASIEIESYYTTSGRPELIALERRWFDAEP